MHAKSIYSISLKKLLKVKLLLISFLLLSVTGFAQKAKLDSEFSLKAGSETLVTEAGLKIKFGTVVEDSRCPEGVDCIWAGNGKITVTLKKGRHKAASFELNTMMEPKGITYQGYEIKLVKLDPYPKHDVTAKKSDYVATLVVSKKKA